MDSPQAPDGAQAPPAPRPNRRNHYRVLHVQPEAPAEVIKASYRTLMTRLRMHPDLGGTHEGAALLNEAYAVLSDPERRAEYDRQLRLRMRAEGLRASPLRTAAPTASTGFSGSAWASYRNADFERSEPRRTTPGARMACAFCGATNPVSGAEAPMCAACGAPLSPVRQIDTPTFRSTGPNRRRSDRRTRDHEAIGYWGSPAQRHRVRWRDLSAHGVSLWSPLPLSVGQRMQLLDADIQAVAEVLGCERRPEGWLVRGRLLTMRPLKRSGLFHNSQA